MKKRCQMFVRCISIASFAVLGYHGEAESINAEPVTTNRITFNLAATWPGYVRGTLGDARISGNHAYALVGGKLVVYEITSSGNLIQKGSVALPLSGSTLCVNSHYAYIGGGSLGMSIVDIADPENPTYVRNYGALYGDLDAGKIIVSNGKAFALDGYKGIRIIDISNPTNPVSLGACTSETPISDFAVVNDRAYLLCDGLSIWDVSDTAKPKSLSFLKMNSPVRLELKGDFACVVDGNGVLNVIDIRDSLKPTIISKSKASGYFPGLGAGKGMTISGNYAFLCGNSFRVMDLSDPREPRELTNAKTGWIPMDSDAKFLLATRLGGRTGRGYFGESQLFLLDHSNPSKIVTKTSLDLSGRVQDMVFRGHFAYIAEHDGLRTLDVSTPRKPVSLGKIEIGGYSDRILLEGDYLYVECPDTDDFTATGYGMQIFDISTPSQPQTVGKRITGRSRSSPAIVVGNHVFWEDWRGKDGWQVMDITNRQEPKDFPDFYPTTPRLGLAAIENNVRQFQWHRGICVQSNLFFILRSPNTLEAYDMTDPFHPVLIGECNTQGKTEPAGRDAKDLAIHEGFAYIITGGGDLRLIDVKDPQNPTLISSQPMGTYGYIKADGNFIFCSTDWSNKDDKRLRIFNLANPTHPLLAGELLLPPQAVSFYVNRGCIYVGTDDSLLIYEMNFR